MSEAVASTETQQTKTVSPFDIFMAFLAIGSTSFGGVVPYLRDHLVERRRWLTDKEFVEQLSISQTLPGLNATNMAVLVGQKLAGVSGSIAGVLGMCAPGGVLMFVVGMLYRAHGDHPWSTSALKGVAAASVGLVLATVVQLSKRSLVDRADFVFIALTALAVVRFHVSVPVALIGVGALAILWRRPRAAGKGGAP